MDFGDDPFDLERFVVAQAGVFEGVRRELGRGAKTGHWMWFVFPQMKGLARSATSEKYGIASAAEAKAYWAHPVLGPRLRECCDLVMRVEGRTVEEIFGFPDDLKLRSSMTLFAQVTEEEIFREVLRKYFGSVRDAVTVKMLGAA
jgi:uncharacterized protein (DUF1810 family)